MLNITGLSNLFKWENLHNWWLTKYFFAPLYVRRTRLGGPGQGGCGGRAGSALGGHVAASLGPQVGPDAQTLSHLHMVRWVDVVKHTAARQLHLNKIKCRGDTNTHA